jgi:hypothetical protein
MPTIRLRLFFGIVLFGLGAASPSQEALDPDALHFLKGQWSFVSSSSDLCSARRPALKEGFSRGLDRAWEVVRKAETTLLKESQAGDAEVQRRLDAYATFWNRAAPELLDTVRAADCPDLLRQIESLTADILLEDWKSIIQRKQRPQQSDGKTQNGGP